MHAIPVAILAVVGLALSAGAALAQQASVYDLTPQFSAPFRCAPAFTGRIQHVEGYSCGTSNRVSYTAAYPVQRVNFGNLSDRDILRTHIQGTMQLYVRPRYQILQEFRVGRYTAMSYFARYEPRQAPGTVLEKYGVVILRNDGIYSWSVTGVAGVSGQSARSDFYALLANVVVR
jgi:hypothetical protein